MEDGPMAGLPECKAVRFLDGQVARRSEWPDAANARRSECKTVRMQVGQNEKRPE